MTRHSHWHDIDDEDPYALPAHDPLDILKSTRTVVEHGTHAWINQEQIDSLAAQWMREMQKSTELTLQPEQPLWDDHYHFHDGTEHTANWLLLLDALNFCFWAEKDQPRWTIEYQGETLNGYWAEAAALKRATEEDIPLWDASYLNTINAETIAHIFRGNQTIPLLKQRVENAREVGRVLLERYEGQFARTIEQANNSAIALVTELVQHFPSFRDTATYHDREVRFFKRAQICVADLAAAFHGTPWGNFQDLAQLTIYADYKLPQVLRHYDVLEYHTTLAKRIDAQILLEHGSEEEVEIRSCTIWACELLRRALELHGYTLTVTDIDRHLWFLGQHISDMQPYHRTRTIYY
jgi:hypothetical protein